ncbi:UDP-glucose 4-epimerase GalE [Paenibacillus camelliae]|uniref:UDP-glucose 4-epimerase GalE n=1 Tax=Paenibacillus camelliae TaxID=512410 RepID=UPI00203DB520|nr:UDP-glucose 4-epimerase GalE [Paenibacillus camelliae]MCM3633967.1 UDP-glucose 4-epimerase GalE [Paenibacillus camelliae]
MNILVTGGAGYIGSHTCVALLNEGHSVIIADNFVNSNQSVINNITKITKKPIKFYNVDVTNETLINNIFRENKIDGVIHFAGLKAVGESIEKPISYYFNNIVSTILIAKMCQMYNVNRIVFSSSATVYGNNSSPFTESMKLLPTTNPYGETKVICERILLDVVKINPRLSVSILRYFNPIGAHESGLIGESPNTIPNNIMPFITQVAKRLREKLYIFGNDYPTKDGTGIRDYIHVMDLAEGHVASLNNTPVGYHIYNLGTGIGTSVLELVKTFEETNKIKIPYEIVGRRPGDIALCYADVTKAQVELGWTAKCDLTTMCRDAWRFEKNQSLINY